MLTSRLMTSLVCAVMVTGVASGCDRLDDGLDGHAESALNLLDQDRPELAIDELLESHSLHSKSLLAPVTSLAASRGLIKDDKLKYVIGRASEFLDESEVGQASPEILSAIRLARADLLRHSGRMDLAIEELRKVCPKLNTECELQAMRIVMPREGDTYLAPHSVVSYLSASSMLAATNKDERIAAEWLEAATRYSFRYGSEQRASLATSGRLTAAVDGRYCLVIRTGGYARVNNVPSKVVDACKNASAGSSIGVRSSSR